ncbi:MAG: hypothetical protein HFI02_09040 [Lachnospiraceae bacterium]|nr:hypothetical protein [Lachnospiraceae bacterium]
MNWNSQESALLPQANFKMGGFSDSEAGRLNCYVCVVYRYQFSLELGIYCKVGLIDRELFYSVVN